MNCMTSVIFLPVLSKYQSIYASPFTAGGGMSGLVASFLGIIQNLRKDLLFSIGVYFYLISLFMISSGIFFSIIHFHPRGKNAQEVETSLTENLVFQEKFSHFNQTKIKR